MVWEAGYYHIEGGPDRESLLDAYQRQLTIRVRLFYQQRDGRIDFGELDVKVFGVYYPDGIKDDEYLVELVPVDPHKLPANVPVPLPAFIYWRPDGVLCGTIGALQW